jgi:hypothetical protein
MKNGANHKGGSGFLIWLGLAGAALVSLGYFLGRETPAASPPAAIRARQLPAPRAATPAADLLRPASSDALASAPVQPAVPPAASPEAAESPWALPMVSLPPKLEWGLNAEQTQRFEHIALQFLAATDAPSAGTMPDERAHQAKWAAARESSDEQFRQVFGDQIFVEQQTRVQTQRDPAVPPSSLTSASVQP